MPRNWNDRGIPIIQLWIISILFLLFFSCNRPVLINETIDSLVVYNKDVEIIVYYNDRSAFDRDSSPDDLKSDYDVKIEVSKDKVAPIAKLLNKIKEVKNLQKINDMNRFDFNIRCDILSFKQIIYSFAFAELSPEVIWINGNIFKHDNEFPLDIIPYLFMIDWKLFRTVEETEFK